MVDGEDPWLGFEHWLAQGGHKQLPHSVILCTTRQAAFDEAVRDRKTAVEGLKSYNNRVGRHTKKLKSEKDLKPKFRSERDSSGRALTVEPVHFQVYCHPPHGEGSARVGVRQDIILFPIKRTGGRAGELTTFLHKLGPEAIQAPKRMAVEVRGATLEKASHFVKVAVDDIPKHGLFLHYNKADVHKVAVLDPKLAKRYGTLRICEKDNGKFELSVPVPVTYILDRDTALSQRPTVISEDPGGRVMSTLYSPSYPQDGRGGARAAMIAEIGKFGVGVWYCVVHDWCGA